MEVRQAIADIAEVRDRLAAVQRFGGYSGWASIASGGVAVGAGIVQALVAPRPLNLASQQLYLNLWLICLAAALGINYGAILAWRTRHRDSQSRYQVRTVGMSILPAIAAGGVITAALVLHGLYTLLPGMWCATYALGLFASRALVPPPVVVVAVVFGFIATLLLFAPDAMALDWWIMPLAFGGGQVAIGAIVLSERQTAPGRYPF
ncbi:MAG: hypothetical protein JO060_10805 [Candidatus Eremiobacteraeota bacterium]|nr:hypothetical protein [Candidatus Eremiobacteraeota bacterium]